MRAPRLLTLLAAVLSPIASAQPFVEGLYPTQDPTRDSSVALASEADRIRPMIRTETGRALLEAAKHLPDPYRRWVWISQSRQRVFSQAEFDQLDDQARIGLLLSSIPEQTYYEGLGGAWGLAIARPVDLAVAGTALEDPAALEGASVLVVGIDTVLPARLLASLGANADGVLSTKLAEFIYRAPRDTGEVDNILGGQPGRITLAGGVWPRNGLPDGEGWSLNGQPVELAEQYDLIIVVNSFVRNLQEVPGTRQVGRRAPNIPGVGVEPSEIPAQLAGALKPGGRAIIYNFANSQETRPDVMDFSADERVSFLAEDVARAGLISLTHDADDQRGLRAYAELAGAPPERSSAIGLRRLDALRVAYTLIEKPGDQ